MIRKLALSSALLGAILLSCVAYAQDAQEETDERLPDDGWIPSFEAGLLVVDLNGHGSIESQIGWSDSDRAKTGTPTFQLGLNVMTPRFGRLPLGPRLVFSGGAMIGPRQTITAAGAGQLKPGEPERTVEQQEALPPARPQIPAEDVPGQGSELDAIRQVIGWYAAVGLSLDIPKTGSRVRVKPLVGYFGESLDVQGEVVNVVHNVAQRTYTITRAPGRLDGTVFHSIGPGLEAEWVLGRTDHLALSLYGQFYYTWLLNEPGISFADANGLALFQFDNQINGFRGGAGLRLAWEGLTR